MVMVEWMADAFHLQETLFRMVGLPMVENCLSGYNSCMFAYGQVTPTPIKLQTLSFILFLLSVNTLGMIITHTHIVSI